MLVRPFEALLKCLGFSFIINSRTIIPILDERAWHPLQEKKLYFRNNISQNF